jgi:dephospho-CoA kinase
MLIAGLTGNYGMGKSQVLSIFRSLGAVTLDSDLIVKLLLKDEKVKEKLKKMFGNEIIDRSGQLDKKKLALIVFNNNKLKGKLEAMLHPLVLDKVDKFIIRIKDKRHIVVVEVPLLFEGGYEDRFDSIITVYTTQRTAIERLNKAGVSRHEALTRLKVQFPINKKRKLSDYIINNNGTQQQTRKQVETIYSTLIGEMGAQS